MKERILSEPVKTILREQCRIIGADFDKIDFTSGEYDWFMHYEWTAEQELDFQKWLINYLKKCPMSDYRQIASHSRNVKNINKIVDEWCFNYGWKYKKSEDINEK